MGTTVPPCGRSISLSKWVRKVVVIKKKGVIQVPIDVLPIVTWSPPPCAQPVGSLLRVTLQFTPPGGSQVVIGPQDFNRPAPTTPGPQPPPAPLLLNVPASRIPAGSGPFTGTVTVTYSVTFGAGIQNSPISATGTTQVCFGPLAPKSKVLPRLNLCYIPIEGRPFASCRKGDQGPIHFLVENNDPTHAVTLGLVSDSDQTSRLADGLTPQTAYAAGVFSLSAPTPGTDAAGAAFVDDLAPFELIPEPDPEIPDPQRLTDKLIVPPLEARIVSIAMRSHGMCLDGSCTERWVVLQGTFADGSPALACAGTASLVAPVAAKTPLCEFTDELKTAPNRITYFDLGTFDNEQHTLHHAMTHAPGNQPPGPNPFTQLVGSQVQGTGLEGFPSTLTDYLRVADEAQFFTYGSFQPQQAGLPNPAGNFVQLFGLEALPSGSSVAIPFVRRDQGGSFFDVFVNLAQPQNPQVQVIDQMLGPVFQGSLSTLLETPPEGIVADGESCRRISKSGNLNALEKRVQPASRSIRVLKKGEVQQDQFAVQVSDPMFSGNWSATLEGKGAELAAASGPVGTPIVVRYTKKKAKLAPATNLLFLRVTVPGAINNPCIIPIALRITKS